MSSDATPPDKDSGGLNWGRTIRIALGLGLTIAVGRGLLESSLIPQFGRFVISLDQMGWLILGALALIALFVVVVRAFKIPRAVVVSIVALTAVAVYVSTYFVRIESFSGNLLPRLVWAWEPTAEEKFKAYEAEQARRREQARALAAALTTSETEPAPTDAALAATDHDYPQFLGPQRTATLPDAHVALDWDARPPKELWRHPVGSGWGSFAVVGDYAFTQEQRGDDECVVAYELTTGVERWVHRDKTRFSETHGDGPRATPTLHNDRCYTMGATGLVNCLDAATGAFIWRYEALPDQDKNLQWGMSGSPLILDDLVIVAPGLKGQSLVALRGETGEVAWANGDDPAAYASPTIAELAGLKQILIFNGAGLRGHDARDGRPLWLFPWVTVGDQRVNVAQPVVLSEAGEPNADSLVLLSSGYAMGTALVRVVRKGDEFDVEEVWTSKGLKSKFSNIIVHQGGVYGLDDGIMAALHLKDGKKAWKSGRYGHGQLLLVGDLLWIQAEEGEVVQVSPSLKKLDERAKFSALSSKTWNHLTLAGRILLVRNDREAAAFALEAESEAPSTAKTP